jgi:hypothetical protein
MATLEQDEIVAKVRLTPEQQYEYSTKYWVEIYLKLCIHMAVDMGLGWDTVNAELQKSSKTGWPMAVENLERMGFEERDSRAWAVAEASTGVNAWPGYIDEVVEYSPERTSIKGTGTCVVLEVARKLGIEDKIDLFPWCATAADSYLRKINPKLRFIQHMAMCRGDEYDLGYTELTDHEVTGSIHSYEQARSFQPGKLKK